MTSIRLQGHNPYICCCSTHCWTLSRALFDFVSHARLNFLLSSSSVDMFTSCTRPCLAFWAGNRIARPSQHLAPSSALRLSDL